MQKGSALHGGSFAAIMKCTEKFCASEQKLFSALFDGKKSDKIKDLMKSKERIALLTCQYEKCKHALKSSLQTFLQDFHKNKVFITNKKVLQKAQRSYDKGMKLLNNPNAMAADYIKFYIETSG